MCQTVGRRSVVSTSLDINLPSRRHHRCHCDACNLDVGSWQVSNFAWLQCVIEIRGCKGQLQLLQLGLLQWVNLKDNWQTRKPAAAGGCASWTTWEMNNCMVGQSISSQRRTLPSSIVRSQTCWLHNLQSKLQRQQQRVQRLSAVTVVCPSVI